MISREQLLELREQLRQEAISSELYAAEARKNNPIDPDRYAFGMTDAFSVCIVLLDNILDTTQ